MQPPEWHHAGLSRVVDPHARLDETRVGRAHAQNSKRRSRRLSVRVLVVGSSIRTKRSEEISEQLLARAVKI